MLKVLGLFLLGSSSRLRQMLSAVVLCLLSSAGSGATYWVENTGFPDDTSPGLTLGQAIAYANMSPGLDTIRFKNLHEPLDGGFRSGCFILFSPAVITDQIHIDGEENWLEVKVSAGGERIPEKGGCVTYIGAEPAFTFMRESAGSDVKIESLHMGGTAAAFHLCAENLSISTTLFRADTGMTLCDTSTVTGKIDLRVVPAGESGTVVMDEDLPVDTMIDLNIQVLGARIPLPVTLNLEASECGSSVIVSGVDTSSNFSISAKGCVNLVVDGFYQADLRPESHYSPRSMPFIAAEAWLPADAPIGSLPLTPTIDIVSSMFHGSVFDVSSPLISLHDTAARIRHSTITNNDSNGAATIDARGGSLLLDHTILAENKSVDLQSESTDIDVLYSMVHELQLTDGALVEDIKSNVWRLNKVSPDLVSTDRGVEGARLIPSAASPMLNAGDGSFSAGVGDVPSIDMLGVDRILDNIIDIGAYERNLRPVFDFEAAVAELHRQRSRGQTLLSIDLTEYFSDPDGHATELDWYLLAEEVSLSGTILSVPAKKVGAVAFISAKDSHGAPGDFGVLIMRRLQVAEESDGGALGWLYFIFLAVLLHWRKASPETAQA